MQRHEAPLTLSGGVDGGTSDCSRETYYAQQLFQSEQYDRCVTMVEQLLLGKESMSIVSRCTLLHLLALSLLQSDHLSRAHEVIQCLHGIVERGEGLTRDQKTTWRSRYLAARGEALIRAKRLQEAVCAFKESCSILSANATSSTTAMVNGPLSPEPLLQAAELKARHGLWKDAHCLLTCARQFLIPYVVEDTLSTSLMRQHATPQQPFTYNKTQVLGNDRRADLQCMQNALEALLESRPFSEAERNFLLQAVGSVALEYSEILLREGATVNVVLPQTAEHLCLASEMMQRYLHQLPDPFPVFAQFQLKFVKLLIILGVEHHPGPVAGEHFYLEHAAHMVMEILANLAEIAPHSESDADTSKHRAWKQMHASLTANALEAKGDVLVAQGRHQAAALCFAQSLGECRSDWNGGRKNIGDEGNVGVDFVSVRRRLKRAEALTNSGSHAEAAHLLSSLKAEVKASAEGVSSSTMASVMHALGNVLTASGRTDEARLSYEKALESLSSSADNLLQCAVMDRLATLAIWRGDASASLWYYRHTLRIRRRVLGESHIDVAASHNNLSGALLLLRRYTEAEEHADDCMRLVKQLYTRVAARHLYTDFIASTSGNCFKRGACNRRPPEMEVPCSAYIHHPLYSAAAKQKSVCIQILKKIRSSKSCCR